MSKAFEQYVQVRCEEILEKDKEYQKSNAVIYNILEDLKRTFTPEQKMMFDRYESEIYNQYSNALQRIYIQGFNDRLSVL